VFELSPFSEFSFSDRMTESMNNNSSYHIMKPVRDRAKHSSSKSRQTFFGTYAAKVEGKGSSSSKETLDPVLRKIGISKRVEPTMKKKKKQIVVPDSIKRNTYWGAVKVEVPVQNDDVKDLKTISKERVMAARKKAAERIRKMEQEKRAEQIKAERTVRKELCAKNGESHKKFLRKLLMESMRAEDRRREIMTTTPKNQREPLEKLFAKDRKKEQALITRIYEDLSYYIDPERPKTSRRRNKRKKNKKQFSNTVPIGL
jgi:hypothetical protein